MANQIPKFEMSANGSLSASGTDNWVDLTALLYAAGLLPSAVVPSGSQLMTGFVTCISADKNASFELRPNKPTKSAGNTTDTDLRNFQTVSAGTSADMDCYWGGAIISLTPVTAVSTGVEKLWLRIKCGSASAATYEYVIYCTLY